MKEIIIFENKISEIPSNFLYENNTLTIPKNLLLEDPLRITIKDDLEQFKVQIGENSNIKIVLEILNESINGGNYNIEFDGRANSQLKYLIVSELNSENGNVFHKFNLEKDAHMDILGAFVSNVLKAELQIDLNGEGSNATVRAVALSSNENKQNIDVLITHKAPHTLGDMTNVGIANKKGKVLLNGIAKIEKGMKEANAFQTLKGIITSDDAEMEVNPILLIDEYDVKAGHGATIGKIDEEVLYYLQSRGLTKEAAEKLVIHGFLKPIIDEIDDELLKERFINLVNQRI